MKLFVLVALSFVAAVAAAPASTYMDVETATKKELELIDSKFNKDIDGTYNFSFMINNGNERAESGRIKEVQDKEDEKITHKVIVIRGNYTLNDAEGKPHVMNYEADENGFRVQGDLIPREQ